MGTFKLLLKNKYNGMDSGKYEVVNQYLAGLEEVIAGGMRESYITQPVKKNIYIQIFSEMLDDFVQKRYPSGWSREAIQATEDSISILTGLVIEFYFKGQNPNNLESYAAMIQKSGEILFEEYYLKR
ncbi:hypothetical protein SM124_11695 [Bacillus sp. 31A1R]|uniref:Uncharacterized protein n=1 Tax=Robertmurraya mangrovi TaxID=3098077 RepID=A0ABU5IZ70_9BACI|nr:hypothetical protein [Bacillus sp. 31A1R]MDZ5472411.1 hypothetical protein [Bacillus sp. 31A1R]